MTKKQLTILRKEGFAEIEGAKTEKELRMVETRFLGRKSELNALLKGIKDLPPEEKKSVGPLANAVKNELVRAFACAGERIREGSIDWETDRIDVTLSANVALKGKSLRAFSAGHLHPLTRVEREIEDIFVSMGFEVADGPEVETEFYNFDALNVPADHPARDMQDTFWLKETVDQQTADSSERPERLLLRTHTSAVQVRYMQTHTPPFRIIVPGRVFRSEATDATHEHTYYQFESLMVGDDITVANFKYVAEEFFSRFFGQDVTIRLRPSFFPFVEPGFEFDIRCTMCRGVGCSACKGVGWIEIGGAGMVHNRVFESAGYPHGRYQGFAWGFGLSRLAMMKYKIPDNRLFMSGDIRFLNQF